MRRAGVLRRRHQAHRPAGRGRQDRAGDPAATCSSTGSGAARIMSARRCCRLSQASEAGTIYRPDEIRAARRHRARAAASQSMSTARALRHALVRMNASPAEATWRAGVDVLSFGATKGGALAAEAVVFFDPARARRHVGASQARRPSRVQAPLHRGADSRPTWRTTCGSSWHGTPMRWPIGWRRSSPLPASSRSGRSRPTRCSSRCRRVPIGGSRRRARTITLDDKIHAARDELAADHILVRLVTSFATIPDEVDRFAGRATFRLMPRDGQSHALIPAIVNGMRTSRDRRLLLRSRARDRPREHGADSIGEFVT